MVSLIQITSDNIVPVRHRIDAFDVYSTIIFIGYFDTCWIFFFIQHAFYF